MHLQGRKKYIVRHETAKGTLRAELTFREMLCLLLLRVGTSYVFTMPSLWQVKKWNSGTEVVYIFSFWKEKIVYPKIIHESELKGILFHVRREDMS